jgi:hypothetical protein
MLLTVSSGDVIFIVLFIVAVIGFVAAVNLIPKEDLGPDPDYLDEESR